MTTDHRRVTEGLDVLTGALAPYATAELRPSTSRSSTDIQPSGR